MSKKYPIFNTEQNKEWGNLFLTLEYGSFDHNIFNKLYHKGYCTFFKSETIYQRVAETLKQMVPNVPFEINEVDRLSIEINITC